MSVLHVPLWAWAATVAALAVLLGADLFISARRRGPERLGEAALWTAGTIALAVAFGALIATAGSGAAAGQFFAGWLTEYSLSLDNLLVFILLIGSSGVDRRYHGRVLLLGILLALLLRGAADRRGRCRPAAVRLGGISLRGIPRLRRGPAGVPPPGSGRDGERRRAAGRAPHRAGRARGRRGPADHPGAGTPLRHAAAHPGHRHRGDRCAVRRRLHPGDLRPDPRPVPGLLRQPVRAARPAAPVFPHRRPAEAAGVSARGPGRHPRLHRAQAHRRGAAGLRHRPPRARAGTRDQRRGVAGGHRRGPARHHREQPGLRPPRAVSGRGGRAGGAGRAAGPRRPGPRPAVGPRAAAGPRRARG